MKTLLGLLLAVFFYGQSLAEEKFSDDMNFSVTLERGAETELQYGYFYATKPITEKLSSTYGATWNIDNPGQEHTFDLSSQTVTFNYRWTDNISVYMLNDLNPHFHRTETWFGATYAW